MPLLPLPSTGYQPRTYRHRISQKGLVSFEVAIAETDLWIRAQTDLSQEAFRAIREARREIEAQIRRDPCFLTAMEPYAVPEEAPEIVVDMARAAEKAGVGPMAAVAGAVAEQVGQRLLPFSEEIIIENGGDIFLKTATPCTMGIFAGSSPLSNRIAIKIYPDRTPMGVCTSSGTVGHSKSFGRADAVVVLSRWTALADAVATAAGNRVKSPLDIHRALTFAMNVVGVEGIVVIIGDRIGVQGEVELRGIHEDDGQWRDTEGDT